MGMTLGEIRLRILTETIGCAGKGRENAGGLKGGEKLLARSANP
jgi:hypothetical protein